MSPRFTIADVWNKGWCRLPLLLLIGILSGCSTPPLKAARENFYAGRFQQANQNLDQIPDNDKDTILYLMERGMIRQSLQQYDQSSADWRKAADRDEWLETYSLTHGATSLIVNDRMLAFRGTPFERNLLFAFLAKNYLVQQNWDYAAICARNIIRRLENNNGFPDIPYSRYIAGFCMEMINDEGNAAIQYKMASKLMTDLAVDEDSGQLIPKVLKDHHPLQVEKTWQHELICFVLIGRISTGTPESMAPLTAQAPYGEFYCDNRYLGRSYPLANTAELIVATEKRMAMIQLAKDATRLAFKTGVAQAVKQQNETLGFITELILFSMEMPDTRRWETLPLWLEVARLPCPPNLTHYTVVFKDAADHTIGTQTITTPLSQHGTVYISFCRDISK